MNKQTRVTVHRSAVTGRFVTKETVLRHPRTTVTEHLKKGK
jgi:hypothetical protein